MLGTVTVTVMSPEGWYYYVCGHCSHALVSGAGWQEVSR
jgi:hypothetical protein